ncbi:MAG: hypothetical protein A2X86_22195 [Bdellovibrionales bacterium GWA2_49_15]|nr:MAG: hypothetical protein A2X86_22195 [Bdellovibrionales bacterium GWA2_49_15]HAZ14810.1 hypothetical protein [Bdellovibrionales bacterium]
MTQKDSVTSIQLSSSAPDLLANFLGVILDCELEDSGSLLIGSTRLHFSPGGEAPGSLSMAFGGYSRTDLENFFQRANFYHFRERHNLPSELQFHLPQLLQGKFTWRDWNGWQWTFQACDEQDQQSAN